MLRLNDPTKSSTKKFTHESGKIFHLKLLPMINSLLLVISTLALVKAQCIPSRHKDVAKTSEKRIIFGLKDVLHWSPMEVATTFF